MTRSTAILAVMLVACASAVADPLAADDAPAARTVPTRLAPAMTVSLRPAKIGVLEDYVIEAAVLNETSDKVQIRSARVCHSPDFIRARGGAAQGICSEMHCGVRSSEPGKPEKDCNLLPAFVPVGQSHPLRHHDNAGWQPLFTPSSWPALFVWTDRKTIMTIEVEYSGSDTMVHKVTREIQPDVGASLFTLVVGSWVGALLLAVFSLVYARHSDTGTAQADSRHALRLLVAGIVTGTIVILLIQRVGDLDLPFKFAVNDVIGGLIVGLLSFKLGDVLYKYFFVK